MSSVFPDWQKFAVHQRRPMTGCIPTGYKMILRSVGATGIDFGSFQDDFDLDQNLAPNASPRNDFASIAQAVVAKYPTIHFRSKSFPKGHGAAKLSFIESHLVKGHPVLLSIANAPYGGQGWHIMPVVDDSGDALILLKVVHASGAPETCTLPKAELVRIHDQYAGGDDVAYLDTWQ